MFAIAPYTPDRKTEWDDFVRASKNGTFLFYRDYMEYHSDRFCDFSFLVHDSKDRLISVLPAHRLGDHVISHGGLTYGGFVTSENIRVLVMIDMFKSALDHLASLGVRRLTYKTIPHIYHQVPSGEAWYALSCLGARLVRRDVLSVVSPQRGIAMQERRRRSIRKAESHGLCVRRGDSLAEFWALLERNLADVYGAKPVHSLEEITLLRSRFPENIKLFVASAGCEIIAGIIIYESEMVAHVQYVGTTPRGRDVGAVDLIYHWLLTQYYREKPFFDFGNSVGTDAWGINVGVLEYKESFGARAVVQDFFELDLPVG